MSCQCGCGRLLHLINDDRGLPRQWERGDPVSVRMETTELRCKCGQEDWLTEARGLTSAGLDKYGRMHRLFGHCDPKPSYLLRVRWIHDDRSDPPHVFSQWKVEGLNWATWWFPTCREAIAAVMPEYPGIES